MLHSVKKQVKMPYSMLKPALNMLFIKEETSANRNTLLSTDADVFFTYVYVLSLHASCCTPRRRQTCPRSHTNARSNRRRTI